MYIRNMKNMYPNSYRNAVDYEALNYSLALIEEAVNDEKHDEMFYDDLITMAPTEREKEIIISIRDDERKHFAMFRKIYMDLTDMEIEEEKEEGYEAPKSYKKGIEQALFGELSAVEKYRIIKQGLPLRYHRDMLFEIITDELKHASKYNYLYTLNKN